METHSPTAEGGAAEPKPNITKMARTAKYSWRPLCGGSQGVGGMGSRLGLGSPHRPYRTLKTPRGSVPELYLLGVTFADEYQPISEKARLDH